MINIKNLLKLIILICSLSVVIILVAVFFNQRTLKTNGEIVIQSSFESSSASSFESSSISSFESSSASLSSISSASSLESKSEAPAEPQISEGSMSSKQCGHSWSDATCTSPKTCKICGATEGKAAGHSWMDATYTNPKTCSVCQATEGSALIRETQEITITTDNWNEYFEIKREDIIPEKNAFGEYGTPEDMYYILELVLKKEYSEKLVSINVSVEFVLDTYLQSYDYDESTGIGTVTNEYKRDYNNTDKSLCNFKDSETAYICTCNYASCIEIDGKVIYYAYICESLNCIRAAGTIIIQN